MEQLKSRFKRTNNWNKNKSKIITQNAPNQYLDLLIDQSFQGVNRLFVLVFNANDNKKGHSRYYLPTAKIEEYNVMIRGKNVFGQPIKNYIKIYDKIKKITTGRGDGYATGCLLDYNYFKIRKMIAIDLIKQHLMPIQKQYNKLILLEI